MNLPNRFAIAILGAAFLATSVTAQEHGKPGEKPVAGATAKAPAFVIAKDGDKLEVMAKDAVETKNKQLAEEFEKAKEQFEKDKKAAEATHKKFEGKEPQKKSLEIVGSDYATKDAAEAALKKMHDEKSKGDKPKGEKGDKGEKGKGGEHGKKH